MTRLLHRVAFYDFQDMMRASHRWLAKARHVPLSAALVGLICWSGLACGSAAAQQEPPARAGQGAEAPQPTAAAAQPTSATQSAAAGTLRWRALPPIPDRVGLAGPLVGIHANQLLVGGGANFEPPVWQHDKRWLDRVYALDLNNESSGWRSIGGLPSPRAYAACVSTPAGIAMLGGNDAKQTLRECWLIRYEKKPQRLAYERLPDLPEPSAYGQGCQLGQWLILCGGQPGATLDTASAATWRLDLDAWRREPKSTHWQSASNCPGGARAFAAVTAMKDQSGDAMWVLGGRRQQGKEIIFLNDFWRYDPAGDRWEQRKPAPVPIAAGGAAAVAPHRIAVVSGDDGRLFDQADQLGDHHPGFDKRSWLYDAATDRWTSGGPTPANQVTTIPVVWPADGEGAAGLPRVIVASGEIRPRVRTSQVWEIRLEQAGLFPPADRAP